MPECSQEPMIAAALANGESAEEDLRFHLAGCAVCSEVYAMAREMLVLAKRLSEEPAPSAGSMWWRLNLRMRRERARRAQRPLIWMGRIACIVILLTAAFLAASIPDLSRPVAEIGLLALSAVVLPVAIVLWGWSRSKI